jgi:Winged helix DNA-binding domain
VKELSTRELNRALLARQLLLERSRLPLPRAVERMGGVQAQYAPSTYIGLWSRVARLQRDQVTRALERRSLVQATLMRSTIHVVSAREYWLFANGIREARREWWLRVHRKQRGSKGMESAAANVRALLAEGPRRRAELVELVGGASTWNGIGAWVDLVRAPPSGTWEHRRADLFALADDWVGPSDASVEDGLAHLLKSYLGAFGPARLADAANWAGVDVKDLRPAAEGLRLRTFLDEEEKELLDLPRAPLPPADTPAPPRLLPTWDATLLVHARRTQLLPEPFRPRVFDTKTPHSVPTFLVDGVVAGTWRVERTKTAAALRLEPFEPLPRTARRALAEEAEQLLRFHEPDAHTYRVRG